LQALLPLQRRLHPKLPGFFNEPSSELQDRLDIQTFEVRVTQLLFRKLRADPNLELE